MAQAGAHMRNPISILAVAVTLVSALSSSPAGAQAGPGKRRDRPQPVMAPPGGTGRLRNAAQGMCLDVAGWGAQGDGNVLLWECNRDPDQVWSFAPGGELHNVLTGTCLDAAGYDGAAGANVDIYRCEGLDDQRWALIPRGAGRFELHNLKRGLCLDVAGYAGARGDNVALWTCDGGTDQIWSFEPYAAPPRPAYMPPPPRSPPSPTRELEVPPPPAPPREARLPRPMDEGAFQGLTAAVRKESFSETQLDVIRQAASRNFFRVGQLKALIDLLSFSATKLSALEIGAPRVVDPENAYAFYEAFTFSADKEQAKQILRRSGY
jgi:ricin-type beta-trefoil lectin protein/uncharacterized protein DUF4476